MDICIFQKGFNFSQDGPGNRLVYHLQGCNMRCPWCSNPEGMCAPGDSTDSKYNFKRDSKGDSKDDSKRDFKGDFGEKLNRCCETIDTDDIIDEVSRSRMMFFDGGGVTFTGGEATLQFEPLRLLLSELKAMGVNTALETNGSCDRLTELFPLIDFLMIDLKHYDDKTHIDVIGHGNKTVVENILSAAKLRSQLLIRIPLIGGFNASARDAEGFSAVLAPVVGTNSKVEVLRYHEYGRDKWARCGMKYNVENAFVSDSQFLSFCRILTDSGIEIIKT